MFGMRLALNQSLRLEQSPRLKHRLEQRVQVHLFETRRRLAEKLNDEHYQPHAECPSCSTKLKTAQILKGFRRSETDFSTKCPRCKTRFAPQMICFGRASRVELPFYCSMQVLGQLRGLGHLSPEAIARNNPAAYRSAIVHHGSLAAAFEKLGVPYKRQELPNWQRKIIPFLGKLPDTAIARFAGTTSTEVRKMRLGLKIPRFTKHIAAAAIKKVDRRMKKARAARKTRR